MKLRSGFTPDHRASTPQTRCTRHPRRAHRLVPSLTLLPTNQEPARLPSLANVGGGAVQRPPEAPDADSGAPAQAKRVRLTTNNLRQHTRLVQKEMGRAKKSVGGGTRGSDQQTEPSDRVTNKSGGTRESNTTTTDPRFGEALLARNIKHGYSVEIQPPNDVDAVKHRVDDERSSQPPDERAYRRYLKRLGGCYTEDEMRDVAWKHLVSEPPDDDDFYENINGHWNEVKTDLTSGLSAPKPDRSMSYRIQLYPDSAVEALGSALRPSGGPMAMPHSSIECKTLKADFVNAVEQSAYNGAVMVEGARKVHRYLERPEEEFYGRTEALTIAYNGETAKIFANHAIKREKLEYHHAPLFTVNPTASLDDYRTSRRRLRNCQDWTRDRERRKLDDLIAHDQACKMAQAQIVADEQLRIREEQLLLEREAQKAFADAQLGPLSPPGSNSGTRRAPENPAIPKKTNGPGMTSHNSLTPANTAVFILESPGSATVGATSTAKSSQARRVQGKTAKDARAVSFKKRAGAVGASNLI